MNWPWKKQVEYEEQYEGKSKQRKAITLHTISEKILIREMKANPEFGLSVALKKLNVADREPKSINSQLEEMKKFNDLIKDLSGDNKSGFGLKDVVAVVAEIVPAIPQLLEVLRARQLPQQPYYDTQPRQLLPQGQPTQAQEMPRNQMGELVLPNEPVPVVDPKDADDVRIISRDVGKPKNEAVTGEIGEQKPVVAVGMLADLLEMQADECVVHLTNYAPQWLPIISSYDYTEFCSVLRTLPHNPETSAIIESITHPSRREWLEEVIRLCREAG